MLNLPCYKVIINNEDGVMEHYIRSMELRLKQGHFTNSKQQVSKVLPNLHEHKIFNTMDKSRVTCINQLKLI